MGFFQLLESAPKWLSDHPWLSFAAGVYAWATAMHLEQFHSIMDASTPVLKWFSVVFALGIAIVTFFLKLRELVKGKKAEK